MRIVLRSHQSRTAQACGHVLQRYPECGATFDPQDANTYLLNIPTAAQTFSHNMIVKTVAKFLVVALLYCIAVLIAFPEFLSPNCGTVRGISISRSLLNKIIQANIKSTESSSIEGSLSFDDVRCNLEPSWYSRDAEPRLESSLRWNSQAIDIKASCVIAIIPILCMIVFTKHWLRNCIIALSTMCILLVLYTLYGVIIVDRYSRVTSHNFVTDYVILPNINWREPETLPFDGLIAFEKHPWPRAKRVVARNAWSVRIIKESEFQKILTRQPEAKQAWDKCLAAGECITVQQLQFQRSQ